jgi:hypothetical protein
MFTVQNLSTFRDFEDDNGDNQDDRYHNSNLAQLNLDNIFREQVTDFSKSIICKWFQSYCEVVIRENKVDSLHLHKKWDLIYYHLP